jgi:hypothetical protein
MRNLRRAILAMLFMLSLTAAWAWADDDPPGRAVRLQYMSGSVSIQPNGTDEWVAGALNRPLTNSDNVWTDQSSRAELNVGTGLLRMSDETSLTLTNVSDNAVQVQLHQGTLTVHVRRLFGGEIYEIDTPNLAFTVQKSGDYRFDVDPNGDATVVTVRKGEGDATGQGPGVRVRSNQQVRFSDGTSMTHEVAEAPAYDGFDSWCAVRDKRADSSLSARYVAPGTVGYEDLDDHGVWREEPTYGPVWVPTGVEPGWAPYQFGRWVWVAPWGWTWVDDAPWGYAPFHYGRWVYTGGYWGWAPGPVYVRPVYAPALVAWFGGPGWGVSLGFGGGGGYGWCPLGWGEPFYPWYGGSRFYFRNVNISNTRILNINNYYGHPPNRFGAGSFHYANMRALTAVPSRTLANGVPVRGTAIRVSAKDLASAPMGRVNVAPTRNRMLGEQAARPAAAPPSRAGMRPVVSRLAPPARVGRATGTQMGVGNGQKPFPGRAESSPLTPSRIIPHGPENAGRGVPSPALRGWPRPSGASSERPMLGNSQVSNSRVGPNVPRPPTSGGPQSRTPESRAPQSRDDFSGRPAQRSVPRPPAGFNSRESQPSIARRSELGPATNSSHNRPNTAVPRPTGPVRPASQYSRMGNNEYGGSSRPSSSSPPYRGGYGDSPGYNQSQRSNAPRYSAPPAYRPGAVSPSYHQSAPAYGGGGAPSYHGGGSGAPSYRGGNGGAPSYHGGGGGAPSSHGGGGGSSSGHGSSGGHSGHR